MAREPDELPAVELAAILEVGDPLERAGSLLGNGADREERER